MRSFDSIATAGPVGPAPCARGQMPSVTRTFANWISGAMSSFPMSADLAAAEELVRSVGELIPQYNGSLTHEVTYRPGNDHRAYSQSANTILAHTEAPGWHPSPAYLALFCHRQARCGGGHTDLLDVRRLVAALDADELALMTEPSCTSRDRTEVFAARC